MVRGALRCRSEQWKVWVTHIGFFSPSFFISSIPFFFCSFLLSSFLRFFLSLFFLSLSLAPRDMKKRSWKSDQPQGYRYAHPHLQHTSITVTFPRKLQTLSIAWHLQFIYNVDKHRQFLNKNTISPPPIMHHDVSLAIPLSQLPNYQLLHCFTLCFSSLDKK